jgi:DNA adenine methylase
LKSILTYIGRKSIDIDKYAIKSFDTYCEPFGGGFNSGFQLIETEYVGRIVYNDLDKRVVNFWNCIKENSDEVHKQIVILREQLNKETDNTKIRNILENYNKGTDKFKVAAAEYIYRKNLGLNGFRYKHNRTGFEEENIYITSVELQNVEIYNKQAKDIIHEIDSENTFMLVDPPYICDKVDNYYRCDSSKFNHDELKSIIDASKGKYLITYNDCEYIRNLYKDYKIEEVSRKIGRTKYVELYITNE